MKYWTSSRKVRLKQGGHILSWWAGRNRWFWLYLAPNENKRAAHCHIDKEGTQHYALINGREPYWKHYA